MQKLLQKWQTWIAIVIGLLTIVGMIFDLPGKIRNTFKKKESSFVLSGVIWDGEHKPLSGVTIRLRELGLTDTTNQDGEFRFDVKSAKTTLLHLVAQKDGYVPYDTDVERSNTKLEFTMRQESLLALSGVIWDENRDPLAGVSVRLPVLGLTDTTNQDGEFKFRVKVPEPRLVNLIATKDGYETVDTDAMLGETDFNFKMPRWKPDPTAQREPTKVVQILSGIIWGEGNDPLAGVTVTLVEFDMTTTTNQYGKYKFQVTAKKQQTVNLIAQKAGYETYNTYAALGNPAHNFAMERKP